MDADSLKEQEKQLLKEWAAGRKDFIPDGVVDAEKYLASEIRLLYLLKEVNGGSDWDLRDFLRGGGRKQTWDNIARWTLGIRDFQHDIPWERLYEISEEQRKEVLQSICAVNVKKNCRFLHRGRENSIRCGSTGFGFFETANRSVCTRYGYLLRSCS